VRRRRGPNSPFPKMLDAAILASHRAREENRGFEIQFPPPASPSRRRFPWLIDRKNSFAEAPNLVKKWMMPRPK
jgi:hypothetical protein